MSSNGKRLGDLLLSAGVITKRQLAKAIQRQAAGDKRKLGEILIDLQYITVEDITEIMMEQASEVKSEQEKSKRDFLLQKQILKAKTKSATISKPAVVVEEKKEGLEARILQHEIDHLSGKLFVDYLSSLKRNMIIKRVQKLQKKGEI